MKFVLLVCNQTTKELLATLNWDIFNVLLSGIQFVVETSGNQFLLHCNGLIKNV